MSKPKRSAPEAARKGVGQPWRPHTWHFLLAAAAALLLALEVYGPALSGPFVFDDQYLPFAFPDFDQRPLLDVLRGLRPVLMLSFWLNYRLSGMQPYSYHLFNVLLHVANSLVVFAICNRLLRRFEHDVVRRLLLAAFGAGLFLLHPLQTESVAYVTSRSEALSILFAYAAVAVFLGQQEEKGVGWLRAAAVLVLFGLACLTKEHAAALPAVLLLADYYWHPGFSFAGIRRNWRLYVPMAGAAALGGAFVYNVLRHSDTAGFSVKGLPWNEYFYSQWRAVLGYLRLFVVPVGQNVDHDFPVSRTPLDHWALFCLVVLLALAVAAILWRKRYPLASFGVLFFFLLVAPTSSVVPIRDLFVERRFYLPSLGVVLAAVDLLRLWPARKTALAAAAAGILALCSVLAWQRNQVWSSDEALWSDAVSKSPALMRPHSQLALVYFNAGRCSEAAPEFEKALRIEPSEYRSLVNYGLTLDCLHRPAAALGAFRRAAAAEPRQGYPYALMGMIYGKQGDREEAMKTLNEALRIEPGNDMAYLYRGNLHVLANELDLARSDYSTALRLNPHNGAARAALERLQAAARTP